MLSDENPNRRPWYRNTRLRRIAGVVFVVGVAVAGAYALNGQRAELSGSLSLLENSDLDIVAVAVIAESLSVLTFGYFNWYLLRVGLQRPPLAKAVFVSLASTTINNSVPGGAAFSSVYAYREFRGFGADPIFSSWTVLAINLLSGVGLAILAILGVATSLRTSQGLDLFVVVPILALVLIGLAALVATPVLLVKVVGPPMRLVARLMARSKRANFSPEAICARLMAARPTFAQVLVAIVLALFNWVFDAMVLVLAYKAIHGAIPWRGLLLAYGAGQLAANLPVTPGGLGVVEGSLSIALVAYGGAQESAVAAVLLYRLVSFWMTIPVGWVAYFSTSVVRKRRDARLAGGLEVLLPDKDLLS